MGGDSDEAKGARFIKRKPNSAACVFRRLAACDRCVLSAALALAGAVSRRFATSGKRGPGDAETETETGDGHG